MTTDSNRPIRTAVAGFGLSGFGHEGGAEGLTVYMQTKFVSQLG